MSLPITNIEEIKSIKAYQLAFIFFALFLIQLSSIAQAPDYKFKHIFEKEGLPLFNIQLIYKDSRGFMWFGSDGGLMKYDGYTFTTYQENLRDSSAIPGNYLRAIVENKDSNLWIATTFGLALFDIKKNTFTKFLCNPNDKSSISSNNIFYIEQENGGNLWIATIDSGLNYYDLPSKKFIHFRHNKFDTKTIGSDYPLRLLIDRSHRLWIGMATGGIDILEMKSRIFKHILLQSNKDEPVNRTQIRAIVQDTYGDIWIGTSGMGVYKIIPVQDTFLIKHFELIPGKNSLSNNYVSSLAIDQTGNLLIGTENGGLNYLDIKNEFFYYYTSDKNKPSSLANNSIWSIYVDNESNLWVGTFSTGLNLNLHETSNFAHYVNIVNDPTSLSSNTVSCFYEDHRGNIWIGTDGGGLNLFDKNKGTFKAFTTKNSNLGSDAILSILEDSKNNLWVGTWAGGLSVFDREMGTFKQFNSKNSGLSCDNVITIYEDKKKTLWAGTFWCDGGVNYFDQKENRFYAYTQDNSGLSENTVFCMIEDYQGTFWLGTNNGISYFNRKTKTFKVFRPSELDSSSLSQSSVMSLLESHDSVLWIATANGLNRFDPVTQKFKRFYIRDGLPNNYISGMEEDENGNLWLATQDGISRYSPKTGRFSNYKPSHGLQGRQFFRCSHYKTKDGTIYFGGTNGFNMFQPKNIIDKIIKPGIYLTNLTVVNRVATIGRKNSPLKEHISLAKEIILSYRENSFSIDFAAINYISPEEARYAYKLEGFDKDWIYSGNLRTATYTNINPGKYIFKVKVPYNSGIENNEGISISVIITPPYYKTWWFRILSGLFFIALLLGIYAFRVKSINERNRLLTNLVDERTLELKRKNSLLSKQTGELNETNVILEERQQQIEKQSEELISQKEELEKFLEQLQELNATKDKFFSIIAHDIKNPFNTVLGFTELLQLKYDIWDDEKRKQMIDVVSNSATNIYKLLENLLQWSRSQRGIIEFKPENILLRTTIENIFLLQADSAKLKNIELKCELIDEACTVMADKQMFDTILRNLVSNAIKFTRSGGQIIVTGRKDKNKMILSITDTGIGIASEDIEKLFRIDANFSTQGTNQETGTGLGLILTKEFVTRHKGTIEVFSEIEKGSTFSISLPA